LTEAESGAKAVPGKKSKAVPGKKSHIL